MSRRGIVFVHNKRAGVVLERDDGSYLFEYDQAYLSFKDSRPVSLTLPLQNEPFHSKTLFPFFDGLIPEGWLLNFTVKTWKVDSRDRMGLLLAACADCIGAVHVERDET